MMHETEVTTKPPAIDVRGLTKRYAGRPVVDGLTFQVASGEIFALLGPNGAGKTTTVEMLEGYRRRDGGEARVLGLDPQHAGDRLRRRIGLMLQEGGVYPQARPPEMLRLFARFYDQPDNPERLLALVGLSDARHTPYRRLSGGQKQRLSLALALVGRPELVFLDEPTAGLDPQARRLTWTLIRSLRENGVTVLLTTHMLDEAEALADRVAIVDRGRLVALGSLDDLRGVEQTTIHLTLRRPVALATLAAVPGVRDVRETGAVRYALETTAPAPVLIALTTWAAEQEIAIRELRVGGESLEEIYLRLTTITDPS